MKSIFAPIKAYECDNESDYFQVKINNLRATKQDLLKHTKNQELDYEIKGKDLVIRVFMGSLNPKASNYDTVFHAAKTAVQEFKNLMNTVKDIADGKSPCPLSLRELDEVIQKFELYCDRKGFPSRKRYQPGSDFIRGPGVHG